MILGAERDAHIAALRASPAVVKLTRGEHVHPALDSLCRKLAFALEPDDFSPRGIKLVPLWEGENSITGFYFSDSDSATLTFIRYDVEYIEQFRVVGSTIEQAIRDMLVDHVEGEDIADVLACLGLTGLDRAEFNS